MAEPPRQLPLDLPHEAALSREDYLVLSCKVCDFYASAYPEWSLPEVLVQPLA